MMQKILFPHDLSVHSRQAYLSAVRMAVHLGAELHVLHATPERHDLPDAHVPGAPASTDALRAHLEVDAAAWTAAAGSPDATVATVFADVHESVTAVAIVDYAVQHGVDAVVMGTHGRRGLRHLLFGSVAESVVREAPCPVLTVHSAEDVRPVAFDRFLVPIDFSRHAGATLAYAKRLAARFGASLMLVFVAEEHVVPILDDTGRPAVTFLRTDPEISAQAEAALRQLEAGTDGPEVPVTFFVQRGNPVHEVLALATAQAADLIVMSRHGHTTADNYWLGGVTEKVVRGASCPVLTLPASEGAPSEATVEAAEGGDAEAATRSRFTERYRRGPL